MATIKLRNGTELTDHGRPYIVAEVNTSHFGKLDTAKEMIDRVQEVGCDCVKFQSWTTGSLYSETYYQENPIAKRFIKKFSLSEDEMLELSQFSARSGVAFASTPYSRGEVNFLLDQCDAPYVKVASMDLNNYPFLEYIARTGAPIVLSTGMGEMAEIHRAVDAISDAGNDNICILHCVSAYPAPTAALRLNNIVGLRQEFPDYPIGYSDHSLGTEMAAAAVALGACMIEKHFTLDQSRIGMDNGMATEPEEMARLVTQCRNVHQALGDGTRVLLPEELEHRVKMRRSIVAARDLTAGTRLTEGDLDVKRPGTGLPPERIPGLVGRVLVRNVMKNTLLAEADTGD